jgi:hypothetical protein
MLLLPLSCQFLSFGDLVENYLSFSVILPSASMTNIFLVFLWEAVAEKLTFSPDSIALDFDQLHETIQKALNQ